jgi:hypothetical protein
MVIILSDIYQLPLPADWFITVIQHMEQTAHCVVKQQPQVLTNDSYQMKCKTRQNQGKYDKTCIMFTNIV